LIGRPSLLIMSLTFLGSLKACLRQKIIPSY
jgi:hypothetical protein